MFATVKAYVLKDYRWPSATTTFNVDIPGADGLWNTAFEAAMARWNDAAIFDFRIRRDTYEDPCNTGDSENGVGFADDVCGGPCCMDHPEGCLIIVFFNTGDNLDAT